MVSPDESDRIQSEVTTQSEQHTALCFDTALAAYNSRKFSTRDSMTRTESSKGLLGFIKEKLTGNE